MDSKKKKVLILGGAGMLGHQVWKYFVATGNYEVGTTLRKDASHYPFFRNRGNGTCYECIDVRAMEHLLDVFSQFCPDVVINCIGIVKQRPEAKNYLTSIEINALLPHRLVMLCKPFGARLIHISTDCVFDGRGGNYTESDRPNAEDLYGKSKHLGEIDYDGHVTLRTSIIGPELDHHSSLLDWFLSTNGPIKGFHKAIFSGVTTIELARLIDRIIQEHPSLAGLYHVASTPISKYDLLTLINNEFGLGKQLNGDHEFVIDRSLDGNRLTQEISYTPPPWPEMIKELHRNVAEKQYSRQ